MENTHPARPILIGFFSGGFLAAMLFFGMHSNPNSRLASIFLAQEDALASNSLIQNEITDTKNRPPATKHLIDVALFPSYNATKNTFRYFDAKKNIIAEYDITNGTIKMLTQPTIGIRNIQWSDQGEHAIISSPFESMALQFNTRASISYPDTVINPTINKDGTRVAYFTRTKENLYDLIVSDLELKESRSIFQTRQNSWTFHWIDNTRILMTNIAQPAKQQVFILTISTKEFSSINEPSIIEHIQVVDNQFVVIRSTNTTGLSQILISNLATQKTTPIQELSGNTICGNTIGTSIICARMSSKGSRGTRIEILKSDLKKINEQPFETIKDIIIPDKITGSSAFVSYNQDTLYIYDKQEKTIYELALP